MSVLETIHRAIAFLPVLAKLSVFCGRAFHYTAAARKMMWSLTLPQVAATLAAALVAYRIVNAAGQPLLDSRMLNGVLIMVLVTAILGPVLTQRFAPRLATERFGEGFVTKVGV